MFLSIHTLTTRTIHTALCANILHSNVPWWWEKPGAGQPHGVVPQGQRNSDRCVGKRASAHSRIGHSLRSAHHSGPSQPLVFGNSAPLEEERLQRIKDCPQMWILYLSSMQILMTPEYDSAWLLLPRPHWLPIHFQVQFKVLILPFKAFHSLEPGYLMYAFSHTFWATLDHLREISCKCCLSSKLEEWSIGTSLLNSGTTIVEFPTRGIQIYPFPPWCFSKDFFLTNIFVSFGVGVMNFLLADLS